MNGELNARAVMMALSNCVLVAVVENMIGVVRRTPLRRCMKVKVCQMTRISVSLTRQDWIFNNVCAVRLSVEPAIRVILRCIRKGSSKTPSKGLLKYWKHTLILKELFYS